MLKWDSVFEWGRRASDQMVPAPAPSRDRMLESVIALEQIDVLYQPLIDPRTGTVVGAEALARSTLAPSAEALFARANTARLDERLSRLIQRKALRCAAVWEGALKDLNLSINILAADLCRESYDQWLLEEIAAAGIDPSRVTAEITESAVVNRSVAAPRLARLREAGVTIAIDDFGTGYASLAYLTDLPIDMIKIDRNLVAGIGHSARSRIVVKAMIALAAELGLRVTVEGVESTIQLTLLAEWGCDTYQGFLGAGALSEEELARFVTATSVEAA